MLVARDIRLVAGRVPFLRLTGCQHDRRHHLAHCLSLGDELERYPLARVHHLQASRHQAALRHLFLRLVGFLLKEKQALRLVLHGDGPVVLDLAPRLYLEGWVQR